MVLWQVGWYGVTVLATAQLWLQTMSFVFIELMALFYFILGASSLLLNSIIDRHSPTLYYSSLNECLMK
jgi:hypothetical protein